MDIATKVETSALYEIYGNSLTDKQKQIIDFCVLQDLSLGEVSDLLNISRQAVKYTLDNAILSMLKLEEKLNILNKLQNIKKAFSHHIRSGANVFAVKRTKHSAFIFTTNYSQCLSP